jgi:hypothetical protein
VAGALLLLAAALLGAGLRRPAAEELSAERQALLSPLLVEGTISRGWLVTRLRGRFGPGWATLSPSARQDKAVELREALARDAIDTAEVRYGAQIALEIEKGRITVLR